MASRYTLYSCITMMCFLIVTFSIVGTMLYINNCNKNFTNDCYSTSINCKVNDYYIYNTECSNDDDNNDDDYIYNCYELIITCNNNSSSCNAFGGNFLNYIDAENYFEENYYNETILAYLIDNNNRTCTFTNPNPHPNEGIIGFYSIIFSIILSIILSIIVIKIIYSYCIYNRQNIALTEIII